MSKRTKRIGSALVGVTLLALLWIYLFSGFEAQAPDGFAPYASWRTSPLKVWAFKAVSPEGVLFTVRTEPNEPAANLGFWREALKKRMTDAGYAFIGESDLGGAPTPGYLLELAAPQGSMDYSYLVAVFVAGGDLIIAEAAGEVTKLAPRRAEILKAMTRIDW